MSEDILIMNGDVFMEDSTLDVILNEESSPVLLGDSSRIEDVNYRFQWQDNELKNTVKNSVMRKQLANM